MVRVKIPYGSITPEQLDMFAHIARRPTAGAGATSPPARTSSSTSWTSSRSPPSSATWPRSGSRRREACGDTVRNVQGCHLAGACPYEDLDISPWAEAAFQHFLHHPLAQRLPRKFKINFSGCETDCGQAMFNDAGVIATARTLARRHPRGGLPGVRRRRPRRQPARRARPRGVHAPRGPHGHARGDPPGVLEPRQPRQQAPGPPEVARRHDGLGRRPGPDPQGAQAPRRLLHLARRHPRRTSRSSATPRPASAPA